MNVLLITLIFASFSINKDAMAESKLLREVKRNPDEAKSLCQNFRALNKRSMNIILSELYNFKFNYEV